MVIGYFKNFKYFDFYFYLARKKNYFEYFYVNTNSKWNKNCDRFLKIQNLIDKYVVIQILDAINMV